MMWLYSLVAIVAGISNPLQSGSNSELVKHTGILPAAFTVYAIGAICLLLAMPFLGFGLVGREKLAAVPWWAWIGGFCNVIFLLSTLLVTKRLGSATFTTLVVITAVITSVLLDQFGLMGFEPRPATAGRIAGALLAIAGVFCIARF